MVRGIEFRGKGATGVMNHDWFYGDLDTASYEDFPRVVCKDRWGNKMFITVDSETVGQYTGLKDKNDEKIFEGDIVKVLGMIGTVSSQCGSFGIDFYNCVDYEKLDKFTQKRIGSNFSGVCCDNFISLYEIYWNLNNLDDCLNEVEVIGNKYDNPELLRRKYEKNTKRWIGNDDRGI